MGNTKTKNHTKQHMKVQIIPFASALLSSGVVAQNSEIPPGESNIDIQHLDCTNEITRVYAENV